MSSRFFKLEQLELERFRQADLFPYEAIECQADFVVHAERIVLHVEVLVRPQFLEIQPEASVLPARSRDVPSVENMRVAPAVLLRHRLGEGVLLIATEFVDHLVAAKHALVRLAHHHPAVAAQQRLQVYAEFRVRVPTLVSVILCLFTEGDSHGFVTVVQIVVQDFSCESRAVLCFRPYASTFFIVIHFCFRQTDVTAALSNGVGKPDSVIKTTKSDNRNLITIK